MHSICCFHKSLSCAFHWHFGNLLSRAVRFLHVHSHYRTCLCSYCCRSISTRREAGPLNYPDRWVCLSLGRCSSWSPQGPHQCKEAPTNVLRGCLSLQAGDVSETLILCKPKGDIYLFYVYGKYILFRKSNHMEGRTFKKYTNKAGN